VIFSTGCGSKTDNTGSGQVAHLQGIDKCVLSVSIGGINREWNINDDGLTEGNQKGAAYAEDLDAVRAKRRISHFMGLVGFAPGHARRVRVGFAGPRDHPDVRDAGSDGDASL
jgi:hypothetical protein